MMNKKPRDVPEATDARSRRTHAALSAAMVQLMLEHEFEDIRVQDVLDRAGVGRSTFYSHFRNKEDFLLSDAERFLGTMESHFLATVGDSRRLVPLAELAAHVEDFSAFAAAIERSGKAEDLWGLFVGHFSRLIERRLGALGADQSATGLPRELSARLYAAAAIELIRWWIEREHPITPQALDARFHAMAWRGVAAR